MANINGTNGNDTLFGYNDDVLTGGGGNDTYYTDSNGYTYTITNFGGVGQGTNPTAEVIAEVDTLIFQGDGLTAQYLLLTQNGNDLEITFENDYGSYSSPTVTLQNFALSNLDNLSTSTGASVNLGNIVFDGETTTIDSFDVFNANSTQSTIFNKNTVTFLNDLNNDVNGFDDSDDVINGQGGDDIIDGKSGNDLLRGGAGNNTLIGGVGNDTLSTGSGGNDMIDGGEGEDLLSVDYRRYYNSSVKSTTTFNATTNAGSITTSNSQVSYKNIERLNILGSPYDDLIVGNNGNDTLSGSSGNDTLTGGAGNDKFIYYNKDRYADEGTDIITDFAGVGKGSNPSEGMIASLDTLQFIGDGLTAQNLLLTQNGNNLEISFQYLTTGKVILQNFKLEDLDNLPATFSRPAIGNILFDEETSISDSFDVFDADSTQTTLFKGDTVTFLNDLDNNITGFDNSNDVINGQGGNDIIDGLSGNDLLRGGAGSNTLDGGTGDDTLSNSGSTGDNLLFGADGNDSLDISGSYSNGSVLSDSRSLGNNTLNGGAGNDTLLARGSKGNNLLSGGDGNDSFDISGGYSNYRGLYDSRSLGNNTLDGGIGDDTLVAGGSTGDNLLSGGDGNDYLNISGRYSNYRGVNDSRSTGNNTLDGGAGNDTLSASGSTGNNLLSGGDGNDYLNISGSTFGPYSDSSRSSGNNTLNGGAGDDTLSASGSTGNNTLDGGSGNDTLIGGNGNDSLIGGSGTDTFGFNGYNEGVDSIYDFNATNELIQVSASGFGGELSTPSLSASQFTIGTFTTTGDQRFIYDDSTGGLFFDQDGSDTGFAQVKFAQLSTGLSLTNNNFLVV
jgi:Ca2+-binding RTX toxin-like protein